MGSNSKTGLPVPDIPPLSQRILSLSPIRELLVLVEVWLYLILVRELATGLHGSLYQLASQYQAHPNIAQQWKLWFWEDQKFVQF